jgi:hypothetical protein
MHIGGTTQSSTTLPGGSVVPGALSVSGDLAVDTSAFFVDASTNKVGIGTASPGQELDISSTNPAVRLTDTTTSGLYHDLVSFGNDLRFSADGGGVEADTNIEFFIDNSEKMRITSDGFVTTPYCPSFRVGANSSFTGNNTIHLHASELHDIGNNYNPSNGRFTAPVAGSYYFGVQLISALSDTSTEQNINLRVNNTPINDSRYQGYTNGGAHLKTVVVLSVGDYVTVANGNADTTTYAGGFHNQFMGYLIG